MRPAIQLLLLVLVVPAQLLISQWMTPSAVERSKRIQSLTKWFIDIGKNVQKWTASLTDVETWRKWLRSSVEFRFKRQAATGQKRKQSVSKFKSATEHTDSIEYRRDAHPNKEPNTSPAYEVFKMDDFYDQQEIRRQWQPTPEEEHFAGSEQVRRRNNKRVKFRVGQVMKHKIWGYKGVIVGWDEFAKAPDSWLKANHRPDRPEWRLMPNYAVLVHTGDRPDPQITYVPEENIAIITNTKVSHPQLENYFDAHDGAQYLPNKNLKYFYPDD